MKINKVIASVLLIIALSLSVFYGLTEYNNVQMVEPEVISTSGGGNSQSMGVVLVIEHERDGKLIYKMAKDDDLVIRNLGGLVHYMVKGSDSEDSTVYRYDTGASATLELDDGVTHNIRKDTSEIRIGTGTTAPTYEDYKLETEQYVDAVEALGYSVDVLQMNSTIVATFNIDGTYDITEAGLTTLAYSDNLRDILIFRDVFSPISVISGDILTVKYIIMFN